MCICTHIKGKRGKNKGGREEQREEGKEGGGESEGVANGELSSVGSLSKCLNSCG